MAKKSRAEFDWLLSVLASQREMLSNREDALSELYKMCDSESQLNLLSSLINRFCYMTTDRYCSLLNGMAEYIFKIGYPENEISVTAMEIKSGSDSSQAILQDLKVPLALAFDHRVRDCNKFTKEDLERNYWVGCRHFIAVDEFTGTGSTIVERHDRFKKMGFKDATLDFCIMSGMEDAVKHVTGKGIGIKVFNVMSKGISGYFSDNEIDLNLKLMKELESKLAEKIKRTKISENSLGFRQSESLYYKFNGNIPNNVFPIFWWKAYAGNRRRKTMFTRVQEGY
ncbi:MAG: hypothetical protein NC207_07305 [Bacteroides sp.]|nr:hypothetical protein [Bacteroides sp.]